MMLFEPYGALKESEMVLVDMLRSSGGPAIAVINKTDLVKEPADLEARKEELKALGVFDDIYTISVRDNDGCEVLFDGYLFANQKVGQTGFANIGTANDSHKNGRSIIMPLNGCRLQGGGYR